MRHVWQVWGKDGFVGLMTHEINPTNPCKVLAVDMPGESAWYQLVTEVRSRAFNRTDVDSLGALGFSTQKHDLNIPQNAREEIQQFNDAIVYHWHVIKVTPADHEWIFDHPDFEPAEDSVPDYEARASETIFHSVDAMRYSGIQLKNGDSMVISSTITC